MKEHGRVHFKAHAVICGTCDGAGFVGRAPDDYSSCPDCSVPLNEGAGQGERRVSERRQKSCKASDPLRRRGNSDRREGA